jgi:hypothetical protein
VATDGRLVGEVSNKSLSPVFALRCLKPVSGDLLRRQRSQDSYGSAVSKQELEQTSDD